MAANRKAVSPVQAGTRGETALNTTASNNTITPDRCQSTAAEAQRQRVLEHLKHAPMTTLEARSQGIMHPAARCMELRKRGHEIATEWVNEYCPGGVLHRVARYILKPAEAAPNE